MQGKRGNFKQGVGEGVVVGLVVGLGVSSFFLGASVACGGAVTTITCGVAIGRGVIMIVRVVGTNGVAVVVGSTVGEGVGDSVGVGVGD